MGTYWNEFTDGIIDYAYSGFDSLDGWGYPLFFLGIIAFIYLATGSYTVAVVFILVVVGIYGYSVFIDFPDVTLILYILVLLGLAILFAMLFIKKR